MWMPGIKSVPRKRTGTAFCPLPDPVHLLRIAVRRAACAEDRSQGHGSWAEVMAHGCADLLLERLVDPAELGARLDATPQAFPRTWNRQFHKVQELR